MVVIINAYRFGSHGGGVARSLARRFQRGVVMPIWHPLPDLDPESSIDVVVEDQFDTATQLKKFRTWIGRFDDEVYAFRLGYTQLALDRAGFGAGQISAYSQWWREQEIQADLGDMGYVLKLDLVRSQEAANAIWDDIHEPIELVAYNRHWPQLFLQERQRIRQALGRGGYEVIHVGSTSVPAMVAKPIIDILITVPDLSGAWAYIGPLRRLGYAFIDYPQNTHRFFFRKGNPRTYHVHMVQTGSAMHRDMCGFRDALARDRALRDQYCQLKLDAMEKYRHRRAVYGARKSEMIRNALAR